MQITWDDEGCVALRLHSWEWQWLQAGLRKIPVEVAPGTPENFLDVLGRASPMVPVPLESGLMSPEEREPFL